MFSESNPEVLVVGAGPVGLLAALSLARQGIRVEIVDTGVWACSHSYALALHPQTLSLFNEMGLLEQLLAGAAPVRAIGLYDSSARRSTVTLSDPSQPDTALWVVRQDVLEDMLEKALREYQVRVDWRHELASLESGAQNVSATINRLEKESRGYIVAHTEWVITKSAALNVPFVIGADGYNSRVRRTLNVPFPEVGPAQYYAVFECNTDADLAGELRLMLSQNTTDALWPLPNGACRWSFLLPDYTDPEAERMKDSLFQSGLGYFPTERSKEREPSPMQSHPAVLDEASLHTLIEERAPWFRGHITHVTWRTVVRFERRMAANYGSGRTWLAGDAAHLTGPVGIQSMNVGMFEACDLATTLAGVLRQGKPLSGLEAYGQRWNEVWRTLFGLGGGLKPQAAADPWLALHANQLLPCLPAHGAELSKLAGQLGFTI